MTSEPKKQLRILLVEDDALIAIVLAEILDDMGHAIAGIEATEAGAVHAAARVRPDLMIVDASLREGSGIDAVATILQSDAIPHVFMSGEEVPATCPPAVTLQKPFMRRDLARAIDRAMGTQPPNPA